MKVLKIDITDEVLAAVNNLTLDSLDGAISKNWYEIQLMPVVRNEFIDECELIFTYDVRNINNLFAFRIWQVTQSCVTGFITHKNTGEFIESQMDDFLIQDRIKNKFYNLFNKKDGEETNAN